MEINEESVLSRYLCPEMCQCGIYKDTQCIRCGKDMEYIGDFDEIGLEQEIRTRQLAKLKQL